MGEKEKALARKSTRTHTNTHTHAPNHEQSGVHAQWTACIRDCTRTHTQANREHAREGEGGRRENATMWVAPKIENRAQSIRPSARETEEDDNVEAKPVKFHEKNARDAHAHTRTQTRTTVRVLRNKHQRTRRGKKIHRTTRLERIFLHIHRSTEGSKRGKGLRTPTHPHIYRRAHDAAAATTQSTPQRCVSPCSARCATYISVRAPIWGLKRTKNVDVALSV